jgi:uncharacterized protein (DUF1330 family)
MKAYLVVEVKPLDEAQYARYRELAAASISQYGGRYLARGADPVVKEGEWPPEYKAVIVEFPSMARLDEWYESPQYAKALEFGSAFTRRMIFVEGLSEQPA